MTRFFLSVFSLLLVVACDAQSGAGKTAPIVNSYPEKALPVIAVVGSEIRINGTSVWLGDTLTVWKRGIGHVVIHNSVTFVA